MKKVRISLALCLFLTGCGGGSSESSPSPTPTPTPPPPPPNSAPTLTGSLLLSVPANVSGSLVVDVVDVDGDTIDRVDDRPRLGVTGGEQRSVDDHCDTYGIRVG